MPIETLPRQEKGVADIASLLKHAALTVTFNSTMNGVHLYEDNDELIAGLTI